MKRAVTRLSARRWLSRATLAFAATAALAACPTVGFAQVRMLPAAEEINVPENLLLAADGYWHFAKIGQYQVANARAQEILNAGAEPVQVLRAFEAVAQTRGDTLDRLLTIWTNTPAIEENTRQLYELINTGRFDRRSDPAFIQEQIQRLGVNERAYRSAIQLLRNSGELAVPFMIDTLRSAEQSALHAPVRRALIDLGKPALNPLVAATQADEQTLASTIVRTLGALGYQEAIPYLRQVANDSGRPEAVRNTAAQALRQLEASPTGDVSRGFYQLAEQLYYDRSALAADVREQQSNVWYWSEDRGLTNTIVPASIFNELMSMRNAELALQSGFTGDEAQALWLAANYKREADLPEGATDPTRLENQPPAVFYGTSSGMRYLAPALARALADGNNDVALAVIESMQQVAGQSNLFTSDRDLSPLIEAMRYPDRRVRFEAAFALAAALPQQDFPGRAEVVPLLGEAIGQTGKVGVLVFQPTQQEVNELTEVLRQQGYEVAGETTPESAVAAAGELAAVDVIIIDNAIAAGQIETLLGLAADQPKLRGAAKLIEVPSAATRWETRKVNDRLIVTTTAQGPSEIIGEVERARDVAGALPLDEELAAAYALRAGGLMKNIAISGQTVFDLSAIKNTLLASLDDERADIQRLGGEVLAMLDDPEAQIALVEKAASSDADEETRVSLLQSLARNARFFGNRLDDNGVSTLEGLVAGGDVPLDVRNAAAEARGALNLDPGTAQRLILEQARR